MASEDYSIQFKEPAEPTHSPPSHNHNHSHTSTHPHVSSVLHPSSHADDGTAHHSGSATAPPPMQRQGSVSKMAHVAKNLVKSPVEEKEEKSLQKTVSQEAKKGEVDVGVMEV